MLQAIERYMKQAIVDKVPSVSSSALVSSLVSWDSSRDQCSAVHCLRGNPPCVFVVAGSTW